MARRAKHAIGPLPVAGHRPNASLPIVDESTETSDTKVLRRELERLRVLTTKQAVPFDFPMVLRPVLLLDDDTPWCGREANRLYLQSGQFTSSLRTSQSTTGGSDPAGISWDGKDTLWGSNVTAKLSLTSGQFSSTIKTSLVQSESQVGVSWDGTNTPVNAARLILYSGKFTTTVLDSQLLSSFNLSPVGISWDGTNTPWTGTHEADDKLYLQSGQFTSSLRTSISAKANPTGISWDGNDTPWCKSSFGDSLLLTSGQFTSTVRKSQNISGTDNNPSGINTNKRTTG